MRRLLAQVLLAVSLVSFSSAGADGTTAQSNEKPSWLYVQYGATASLKPMPGQKDGYRLVIEGICPHVTSFTSRPIRDARLLTVKDYLQEWHNGPRSFSKMPPNAALGAGVGDRFVIGIFSLENPKLDEAKETLTYDVRLIKRIGRESDKNKSIAEMGQSIDSPALYIDDGDSWLGG